MVWRERFITAGDGTRLFCREAGEGPPLLLIHGAACDSEFFLSLGARMRPRYRVILYDRRGCGRSDDSVTGAHDSTAHFSQLVSDAACVLRRLDAAGAAVLGCSYGALIALYLANQHPELVNRTLMHEPPAYSMMSDDAEGWEKIDGILHCIKQRKFVRALNRFLLFLASASAPGEQPMTGEEENLMRNGLYFIEHEFAFGFDRSLAVPRLSGQTDPAFLRGANGAGTPLYECAGRLAERQGCAVYDVPGGHNGARERPDEFGDALCGLLEHTLPPGREQDGANRS